MLTNFPRQAVILVGGKGSRLGKITKKVPKPLIKFDKNHFLNYQINYLSQFPFKEILLLCGYKKKCFEKFKHYSNKIKIKIINEKKPLGTGGAISNALKYLDDIFFLCNGDTFFEINLFNLYDSFDRSQYDGIVALKKAACSARYSKIIIKNNTINLFTKDKVKKGEIFNCGFYFLKKKIFDNKKKKKSLEENILPALCKIKKIKGKIFNEKLIDIGVLEDLNLAKKFFKKYNKRKFAILDRDGIINQDYGYVSKWSNFDFIPGSIKFLKFLNKKKTPIFIITNQAGIAKGFYTINTLNKLHFKLLNHLMMKKIFINKIYYCPHHIKAKLKKYKKNCKFRKPNNGFYKLLKTQWRLKSNNAIFIDDRIYNKDFAIKSKIKFFHFNIKKNKNLFNFAKKNKILKYLG
jgi:D-glycero-D-manno-heptose 1,7-bisphosphate phosphatase